MDNKTNRAFSMALITIISLSILMLSAPAMADKCSIDIGFGGKSTYTKYETFENSGSVSNYESKAVDYTMTLALYDSSGNMIDSDSISGRLYPGEGVQHTIYTTPPDDGWEPGNYKFRNTVVATGVSGCT